MAQVGQRPGLDRAARADDRDAVAEGLDLREDVAREQHGGARGAALLDARAEHLLHERVEPRGRLVEDQQLDVEDVLAEGVALVGADTPAGRRLDETQEFFAFFRAELPALLERFRATRDGP